MDDRETLKDIRETVHRIDNDVRCYRDEQLKQRADIAKIEARQSSLSEGHIRLEHQIESVAKVFTEEMTETKQYLGKSIDELHGTFKEHTAKEESDRTKFLVFGWVMLLTVLGYLGSQVLGPLLGAK